MLSEKQKIFCDEYLIDFNATRSYKVAYGEDMSDDAASASGSRLLGNVKVSEYLTKRIEERKERTEITQDMVVNELAKIAFSDISKVVNIFNNSREKSVTDEDGEIVGKEVIQFTDILYENTENLPDDIKAAIKSIKPGRNGVEVEFNDKIKALELLGKHLGMFTDKFEVTSDLGVTIVDDIPKGDDVE